MAAGRRQEPRGPQRSLQGVASAVGVLLVVAGCSESPAEPPELVWVDGEPDGPLEDDPWVRTIRTGEAAYWYAANTGDLTRPELLDTWEYAQIDALASRVRQKIQSLRPTVDLGPQPFAPVAIRESDDGRGARVVGCADAPQVFPSYDDGNRWPNVLVFEVRLSGDGIRRIVGDSALMDSVVLEDGTEVTPEFCDTVRIPRAVFDPPPDPDDLARLRARKVTPPPSPTPGS